MKKLWFMLVVLLCAGAAPPEDPAEIRRGMPMSGDRAQRQQAMYERIIRKVEPDLVGRPERLARYLEHFVREFVNDTRTFAVELRDMEGPEGRIAVTGHFEFVEHKNALSDYFKHLKLDVEDRTEMLPSAELGEQRFGIVTAARCFVYDKPRSPAETLTQCLLGDAIFLLKDDGDRILCRSADGYVGYIDSANVMRVDANAFNAWQVGPRVRMQRDVKVDDVLLPAGALLKLSRQERDGAVVTLPDGRDVPVEPGAIVHDSQTDPRIEGSIATAMSLLETRYVWGGVGSSGIDCSGLVLLSFKTQGIHLPRDSDQQALVGKLVATRWHREGLQRGDLLFFLGSRGRISHTGIYLGDDQFIEATSPVVTITSFNPEHPNYNERRANGFCFARRVIE